MPEKKTSLQALIPLMFALTIALPLSSQAAVRSINTEDYASRHITCHHPVRLTRDCSIWQGPTRPIAFGDYRMNLAAGPDGRTILITRLRPGPDHNGDRFTSEQAKRTFTRDAIRKIRRDLRQHGICLERWQPIRNGRKVTGYYLEFSDNVYNILIQYTVLESEHWLPRRLSKR